MRTEELMGRLATILEDGNAVAGLRFVVADHAIPSALAEPSPARVLPPPDAAAVARAREATSAIEDPELRDLVTRAAARSLERDDRR